MEIYSHFPTTTFSLAGFSRKAKKLDDAGLESEFIQFVLTGEFLDESGDVVQAFVDPILNVVSPRAGLLIQCDYDSLLGISKDIPVTASIAVYPVPDPVRTLSSSVHLTFPIRVNNVSICLAASLFFLNVTLQEFKEVPIHKIPNYQFAISGPRHSIHIFFPSLYNTSRSSQLTSREKIEYYKKG